MTEQTLSLPILQVAQVPEEGQPVQVLVRLWDEAERTVKAQRQPQSPPRRVEAAEQPARVRYAYD
jgi:hypothetical protein